MVKKASQIVFLLILAAVFVSVPVLTVLGRGRISYYEQRTLAPLPQLTRESVLDGSFFTGLDTFLSDHFGGRDALLKADTALQLRSGKPVVNGIVTNTGSLLYNQGYAHWGLEYTALSAAARAEAYRDLQAYVEDGGGTFCLLSLPYQTSYFADDYPAYLDDRRWNADVMRDCFREAMAAAGVSYLEMYAEYEKAGFPREYYLETDHHYSLRGGFAAYQALCAFLRERTAWDFRENASPEDFEFLTVDLPFLGSYNRQLFGLWETSDRAELAYVKEEIPFKREDNGLPQAASVYTLPDGAAPYATYGVYMGGDIAETVIRTDRPDKPDILIYGDSYTNVLEALLWTQADELRSLDLRHYSGDLRAYIAAYRPDIVICVRDETVLYDKTGNGAT